MGNRFLARRYRMPETPPLTAHPIRLSDVARHAGVAKSIASRVLNDARVTVRPETRERVLAAARELGYRPNTAARALNRSQTRSLGMLIPSLSNVVYSRVVRGAVEQASLREFSILIAEDTVREEESIRRLARSHLIDGVIIASARPGHPLVPFLQEADIPHVFALRALPGSGRNVILDDAHASQVAFDHLYDLGHRRIGHVAGPRDLDSARRRAAGFRKRAKELGAAAPVVEPRGVLGARRRAGHARAPDPQRPSSPRSSRSRCRRPWAPSSPRPNSAFPSRSGSRSCATTTCRSLTTSTPRSPPSASRWKRSARRPSTPSSGRSTAPPGQDVTVPSNPEVIVRQSTAPPPS